MTTEDYYAQHRAIHICLLPSMRLCRGERPLLDLREPSHQNHWDSRDHGLSRLESNVPEVASVVGVQDLHLLRLAGYTMGDRPSRLLDSVPNAVWAHKMGLVK